MKNVQFDWPQAKKAAEKAVQSHFAENLKDVEILVLQGAWEGLTYEDMAEKYHLSLNYLRSDVGSKLWKKLSEAFGETVTKTNFKEALQRISSANTEIIFPSGSLPANSPFYIERGGLESQCYTTLDKPGSLIRIKAPRLMGKTSLVNRILDYGQTLGYRTVYLDLACVEGNILKDVDKLLRWLCFQVTRGLTLENKLKIYWDTEILGSNDNCTGYFEDYILPSVDGTLVLALDTIDRIFYHPAIIGDFFGMLRSWHEKGKTSASWQNLRLVLAHSTEAYIPLNINRSPFNAGFPVELTEFTPAQSKGLARLYKLGYTGEDLERIRSIIGGHPYLMQLTFYHLSTGQVTLNELLNNYAGETGIYRDHLREYLDILSDRAAEREALKQIVTADKALELDSMLMYKLHSLGLIEYEKDLVVPRSQLYRAYFNRVL
ncbi:MAG: hypothetical protein N5P05_000904 [Chroococcopsis gigantea SAG 12.99]|jgi:hypothetical protein|nr:AAA-like domain-containing protein [Chlorogloea purpurea SAG 13.99]MDV2999298.1 hypothetical protein [Chroococcopsis gigantea SAG 12.99]